MTTLLLFLVLTSQPAAPVALASEQHVAAVVEAQASAGAPGTTPAMRGAAPEHRSATPASQSVRVGGDATAQITKTRSAEHTYCSSTTGKTARPIGGRSAGAPAQSRAAGASAVAPAASAEDLLRWLCGPGHADLAPIVARESRAHGVPAALLVAVARRESNCRPDVVSRKGAVGRWQILPGGSAARGVPVERLAEDAVNARLAARHLARWHRVCGSWAKSLGIYNGSASKCSDQVTRYARDVISLAEQATRGRRS